MKNFVIKTLMLLLLVFPLAISAQTWEQIKPKINADSLLGQSYDTTGVADKYIWRFNEAENKWEASDALILVEDSLLIHNTRINDLVDTTVNLRVDVNNLNPLVSIDAINLSKVKLTFLDGTIVYQSWGHDHSQYELLREHSYGQIAMTTGDTTNLLTIGVDYLVQGTFLTGCECLNFTQNADGSLTYTGEGGKFLINGTSDLSADKASQINYTLYMDEVPDGTTPHTFLASAKTENISITGIIELTTGMVLSVRAKSNTIDTTITVSSLNVTFVKI